MSRPTTNLRVNMAETAVVKANGLHFDLTPRQKLFVFEYIRDCDPIRACRAVGYASPHTSVQQLLDNDKVCRAIDALLEEKRRVAKVDNERVLKELAYVGFMNPKNLLDKSGALIPLQLLPDEVAVTVKKMKVSYSVDREDGELVTVKNVEVEFWDKLGALKQLTQVLGLIKQENTVVNQTVNVVDWDALPNAGRPHREILEQTSPESRRAADPIEQEIRRIEAMPKRYVMGEDGLPTEQVAPETASLPGLTADDVVTRAGEEEP